MLRSPHSSRRFPAALLAGVWVATLAASCARPDPQPASSAPPATTAGTTTSAPPRAGTAPSTAPGPTSTSTVAATTTTTSTSITVPSTAAQYFVLYVKSSANAVTETPVAVVKGKAGTTTITDGRAALPESSYRVAAFPLDKPGDVDGDGIDDLTELADPVNLNPLNPAPKLDARTGAVIISDTKTFADLSYQGNDVAMDQYLAGLEFVKFWITGTNTAHPAVYFMNTNTYKAHPQFASAVGIAAGRGQTPGTMRGDIVFNPEGVAADGTKGTYRFEY